MSKHSTDRVDGVIIAECPNAVHRDDPHFEVCRDGDDEPPTGTSIYFHADCAPFGATSIEDEIEKERRSRKRGAEMRRKLAEGVDD